MGQTSATTWYALRFCGMWNFVVSVAAVVVGGVILALGNAVASRWITARRNAHNVARETAQIEANRQEGIVIQRAQWADAERNRLIGTDGPQAEGVSDEPPPVSERPYLT